MPNPQAKAIAISERQKNILAQIAHRTTNPYRLVRRAQLILFAAEGVNNSKISQQLQWHWGKWNELSSSISDMELKV